MRSAPTRPEGLAGCQPRATPAKTGRRDARAIPDLIVRDPTGDAPGQADAARGVAEQETILVPLRARLGSGSGR